MPILVLPVLQEGGDSWTASSEGEAELDLYIAVVTIVLTPVSIRLPDLPSGVWYSVTAPDPIQATHLVLFPN